MMYPKNAGPPTHGANEPIPPHEEESYRGFEPLINLRGARGEARRVRRMKELGLLSNPGDIQEVYSEQFKRIGGWWETIWTSLSDLVKWIVENPETVENILGILVQYGIITPEEKGGMEGLTKEQVAAMIEAKLAGPTWEKWIPWLIGGGLGIGLLAVLLRRPAPVYVAAK